MQSATEMLGPGVYVLRFRGRVVHVGWAASVLEMVANHRRLWEDKVPSWFPIKGYRFDSVEWRKCPAHQSKAALAELKEELNLDRAA